MERLTERKTTYQNCDKQGNLTKVNYIEIKDKGLAEEKLCQFEDVQEKHNMTIEEIDAYITEHKKIEEELGIELSVIFKALKNGIYIKDETDDDCFELPIYVKSEYLKFRKVDEKLIFIVDVPYDLIMELIGKNYGKTWALTREELEK